jgi:prepilin-type N-terminal cleavage/methylation domain-containing protein
MWVENRLFWIDGQRRYIVFSEGWRTVGRIRLENPMDDLTAPPRFAHRERRQAFTLIEMLLVLGIMAVLAAFTLPAVMSLAGSQSVATGTRQVADLLVLSRAEAIARHTLTRFAVVTKWPGDQERAFRQMSIWYWDQRTEDFIQLRDWESLPDGVVFESEMPAYLNDSSYAKKDGTAIRGDYVLSNADSALTLHLQKKDVDMNYVEFIPTGAARLSGGTMQSSIFVLAEGYRPSPGKDPIVYTGGDSSRPKNWSQINVESLTGRVQIYRP